MEDAQLAMILIFIIDVRENV